MFSQPVREYLRNATYQVAKENPQMSEAEVYQFMLRHYGNATERFVGIASIRKWVREVREVSASVN